MFHQAAIRITQCAAEPRLAMDVLVRRHVQRVRGGRAAKGRKVVAASSASVTASPSRFRQPKTHHPYNNRTLYGAAKTFNEGLLRSFNDMYGLDYVALRYFNVYGPRMDVHGAYTEVFIRWMERIAAGEPPVIFGDGQQTMDFVYVGDVARANVLAAQRRVDDEVFNVASGIETSLAGSRRSAAAGHGLGPEPEHGPSARSIPCPASRRHAEGRSALLGFGRSRARRGTARARRLVAARAAACNVAMQRHAIGFPIARPCIGRERRRRRRAAHPVGWVTQGPEVAAFEREFAGYVGAPYACAVSNCTTALHLALLAVGVGPGDEVITVSHSFIATANAIRYCGATPVFVDIEPGPTTSIPPVVERGDHTAHARRSCASTRSACRAISRRIVAIGRRAWPAGHRRRGVRGRQRDPLERPVGADRQASRRHRVLLVPPAQGDHDRRRRHDHDRQRRNAIASSGCGASTA